MFLSHSSKPVITTCVCDLCLQERGKADGNIDQCEYTYCVQTKQHFSRHAMLRSMTESCSFAGSVAHTFVFFVFVVLRLLGEKNFHWNAAHKKTGRAVQLCIRLLMIISLTIWLKAVITPFVLLRFSPLDNDIGIVNGEKPFQQWCTCQDRSEGCATGRRHFVYSATRPAIWGKTVIQSSLIERYSTSTASCQSPSQLRR